MVSVVGHLEHPDEISERNSFETNEKTHGVQSSARSPWHGSYEVPYPQLYPPLQLGSELPNH